jgi:hypothetical protein
VFIVCLILIGLFAINGELIIDKSNGNFKYDKISTLLQIILLPTLIVQIVDYLDKLRKEAKLRESKILNLINKIFSREVYDKFLKFLRENNSSLYKKVKDIDLYNYIFSLSRLPGKLVHIYVIEDNNRKLIPMNLSEDDQEKLLEALRKFFESQSKNEIDYKINLEDYLEEFAKLTDESIELWFEYFIFSGDLDILDIDYIIDMYIEEQKLKFDKKIINKKKEELKEALKPFFKEKLKEVIRYVIKHRIFN